MVGQQRITTTCFAHNSNTQRLLYGIQRNAASAAVWPVRLRPSSVVARHNAIPKSPQALALRQRSSLQTGYHPESKALRALSFLGYSGRVCATKPGQQSPVRDQTLKAEAKGRLQRPSRRVPAPSKEIYRGPEKSGRNPTRETGAGSVLGGNARCPAGLSTKTRLFDKTAGSVLAHTTSRVKTGEGALVKVL